jgi:hypothetical protein
MTQGRMDKTLDKTRRGGLPAPTSDRPTIEERPTLRWLRRTDHAAGAHGRRGDLYGCSLPIPRGLLHRLVDLYAVKARAV